MIFAAERATADKINFLARHARGLICAPLLPERAEALDLAPMVPDNTCKLGTAFTVSVDLVGGTTTGISAHDRAATIRALVDPSARPEDFARPGHVFPLVAKPGGVLRRAGHTEAAVDLARLAGLAPVGVLCEVLDDDGSMARLPRLQEIASELDLEMVTIADLIAYRRRTDRLIERIASIRFPTEFGEFTLHLYRSLASGHNHIALVKGTVQRDHLALVRVHSQCFTGDAGVVALRLRPATPHRHGADRGGAGVLHI
jgi:3,4-dihydroxy 2-butanone 4-phosphate synthase/GTP cyclohydrolase II